MLLILFTVRKKEKSSSSYNLYQVYFVGTLEKEFHLFYSLFKIQYPIISKILGSFEASKMTFPILLLYLLHP